MHYRGLLLLCCLGASVLIAAHASPFSSPKGSAAHVSAAINYHTSAAAMGNKAEGMELISTIPESDWQTMISYYRKALHEAQQADIADMNGDYPGFGDHFRDEFIEGLKLILDNDAGLARVPAFTRGQILMHRFGDWYEANFDAIRHKK